MTQSHHESLSAFIDGELASSERAFLLRRLQHDEELRGCYERYHLIGDCLRGHANVTKVDLAARVRAAVQDERAPERSLPWRGGLRWAAGFATTAIVAAAAFWSVQPPTGLSGEQVAGASLPAASEVQSSSVRVDDLRRQLPLLPVSARQSRPVVGREFAPQPDPEAWQQAPVAPLGFPSTHYIILVPRAQVETAGEPESGR